MATTTADAIVQRAIAVIEGLTPKSLKAKFRAIQNDGDAELIPWAEANAAAALRRVQVRTTGVDQPVESSNGDLETHFVELVVTIAYPKNNRYGEHGALDRDRVMDEDRHQLELAIGLNGAANFSPPNADATWREGSQLRQKGKACDYVVIRQTMSYLRQMTP